MRCPRSTVSFLALVALLAVQGTWAQEAAAVPAEPAEVAGQDAPTDDSSEQLSPTTEPTSPPAAEDAHMDSEDAVNTEDDHMHSEDDHDHEHHDHDHEHDHGNDTESDHDHVYGEDVDLAYRVDNGTGPVVNVTDEPDFGNFTTEFPGGNFTTELPGNVTGPASNSTDDPLMCFVCSTSTDPVCDDPFNAAAAEAAGLLKPCASVEGLRTVCRKSWQMVPGDTRVIRSCGHDNDIRACFVTAEATSASHVCHCHEDACNGAPGTASMAAGGIVLIAAITTVFRCQPWPYSAKKAGDAGSRSAGRPGACCRWSLVAGEAAMLCTYVVRRWLRISAARHVVKLTPQQVTTILQTNEHTHGVGQTDVIGHFDTNQLPSNSPCEDKRSEAVCRYSGDHILGVYDGHGGGACALVTASRLPAYIAASLLGRDQLLEHRERLEAGRDSQTSLLESCTAVPIDNAQLEEMHERSYAGFVRDLAESEPAQDVGHGLQRAFLRLDEDLGREAIEACEGGSEAAVAALRAAVSGCVACVAHLSQSRLHLANAGDCRAVLGVLGESGSWVARPLTKEHDCDNPDEVQRITERHPSGEHAHLLRDSRLLGMLAPLRAIGDFRFKWARDIQERLLAGGPFSELKTPPYLTAAPEITYHKLTPRDRFLILASDGLWEQLPASEVVRLVGEHAHGKTTLTPLRLPRRDHTLHQLLDMLEARRKGIGMKPQDANAATHVLRHALSGTEYGLNHGRISQLLTLPDEVVRLFRDDITVTVVMFNPDALRPN